MLSSGNIAEAFWKRESAEASILLMVGPPYNGEVLTSLLNNPLYDEIIEAPILITINGFDVVKRTMINGDRMIIDAVVLHNDTTFMLYSSSSYEKINEFKLIVEDIISSIKLE